MPVRLLAWLKQRLRLATRTNAYGQVASDDEEAKQAGVDDQEEVADTGRRRMVSWRRASTSLACINVGLCVALIVALQTPCSRMECLRQTSVYSPALQGIYYKDVTLQNTFGEPSRYRGPPTPALEDAWHKLYRWGLITIPDLEMHRLNKTTAADLRRYERVPDALGGGYRAMPDVLHQLHCLNTIRQYTWLVAATTGGRPHYGLGSPHGLEVPHSLRSGEVGNRMHADHCIETIRKTLMCHADVTPLLDVVVEEASADGDGLPQRQGDFNVFTRCRDFGRLREWVEKNMVIPFAERVEDTP